MNYKKQSPTLFQRIVLNQIFYLVQMVDASNVTLGVQVLTARGIFVDTNWYWIGVGALLGYVFLFNILFVLFLDWLDRE